MFSMMDEEEEEQPHIAGWFYLVQFLSSLLWCFLMHRVTNKWLKKNENYFFVLYDAEFVKGVVTTRPFWIPGVVLLSLHKVRKWIYIGALVVTGVLVLVPDSFHARVIAFIIIAVYHLLETSSTQRHGEYPILYNAFAMIFPSNYAHAASFGIAIHFVLSSGIAKMIIGGQDWTAPETMKVYLNCYRDSSARPLSKELNSFCARGIMSSLISMATIFLECIIIPASLFFPPSDRWGLTVAMIIFHIGIALIMSSTVAFSFITTFAAYLIGFSCQAPVWSEEWWLAAAIGIGPSFLCAVCQTLLPEQWPISAVSLFMFNGHQAKALVDNFMVGDRRVVVCAADTVKDKTDIVGARLASGIVSQNVKKENSEISFFNQKVQNENGNKTTNGNSNTHGSVESNQTENTFFVHDTVLRVIGFTLLINTELAETLSESRNETMDMVSFLSTLEKYLVSSGRLLEGATGKVLTRAFFVRIDPKTQTVLEVLERAKT